MIVALVTVTAAYAADVPAASTPAPGPSKSAKRAALKHAGKKAGQDDEAKAVAPPAQK